MARGQFMVQIAFLAGPEMACAGEEALGAWLRCQAYCAAIMSGGRIVGARGWDARRWLTTARVDTNAIAKGVDAHLLSWVGQDLVVAGYDMDGDRIYQAKSEGGRKGGQKRTADKDSSKECLKDSSDESSNAYPIPPCPSLPNPSPSSPSPSPSPSPAEDYHATTATTAQASLSGEVDIPTAVHRFRAANGPAIRAAAKKRDLRALVKAFGANVDFPEWEAVAHPLQLGVVVAIMGWSLRGGIAIRAPSGFAKARAEWKQLNAQDRAEITIEQCGLYGIEIPKAEHKPPPPEDDVRIPIKTKPKEQA